MVKVTLKGSERLIRKLGGLTTGLETELGRAAMKGASSIQATAKQKVSGEVLNVRSNMLRSGIQAKMLSRLAAVVGVTGLATAYAAIHEFGGTIRAHRVAPRHKKALHWVEGGQDRFSRGHMIPAVRMPARPYMAPSLDENREAIVERFRDILERRLKK